MRLDGGYPPLTLAVHVSPGHITHLTNKINTLMPMAGLRVSRCRRPQIAAEVAEKLSERYAVIPLAGIDNNELIRVTGINTFADYRALLEYLSANVAVRDVVVVASDRDEVTLALDLTTGWSQVLDSMALDKKIIADEEGVAYVWQR